MSSMNTFLIRVFMVVNKSIIQISHGRLGSQLGTQSILLLHTVGRRTGKKFITPIAYFHTDGFFFLVGSNWGKDTNASWYHNLKSHPRTIIEVRGRRIPVVAEQAQGAENERLWKYATAHHPPYLSYRKMTSRRIPIIILKPID
jgi:deazaflavin-dependent oxidoreductase (nitroreductase family)